MVNFRWFHMRRIGCNRASRWSTLGWAIGLLLLFSVEILAQPVSPTVQLITDEDHPYFGSIATVVAPPPAAAEDGARVFRIYTERAAAGLPSLLGQYHQQDSLLIFQPRFPLLQGRTYWVHLTPPNGEWIPIEVPILREQAPPRLVAIYPSDSIWPANQLKIYLHFDQPMRMGYAHSHLILLDEQGEEVEAPFLYMEPELWDARQERLTVWFDPGRIKSHLIPNQQMGPPLLPERKYRLVVRQDWPAKNGLSLTQPYRKDFITTAPDRQSPEPAQWQIVPPTAGSHLPLQIRFPEPMDHALLYSGFGILTQQEQALSGVVRTTAAETVWQWFPDNPWQAGSYILRVSTDVEDLAGNNLIRAFDRIYSLGSRPTKDQSYLDIPFTVE